MLQYTTGNLLNSDAQALVNTVNTMGVMGKGIALQFKEAFPENYRQYRAACKKGVLKPGQLLIVEDQDLMGPRTIINFPTKTQWWLKSQYPYIKDGLTVLAREIASRNIKSIAIPPLGCGNGGLKWEKVKAMIEQQLGELDAEVYVYEPNEAIKKVLQKDDKHKKAHLTPARAMLLSALYEYEKMGEQANLFVANKLAYFLQRMGEPLRLKFVAHHYGPYSVQIRHVLYALNGTFLNGLEQKDARPFEPLLLSYEKEAEVQAYIESNFDIAQKKRLDNLLGFIQGFESAFSMELLSTVAFMLEENPGLDITDIEKRLEDWSERKVKMFKPAYLKVAYQHLKSCEQLSLPKV